MCLLSLKYFFATHAFLKIEEYHLDIPQLSGLDQEQKYLMDYKYKYMQKYAHNVQTNYQSNNINHVNLMQINEKCVLK